MKKKTYNNVLKATKLIQEKGYDFKEANKIAINIFESYANTAMSIEFYIDKVATKEEWLAGQRESAMNRTYEYGGKHFIPHSKLGKVNSLSELNLRSDVQLGFFDNDCYGRKMKFKYTYAGFYEAMNDSEMDIFKCIENGKLYLPCEHELFLYEGRV